MLTLLLIAALAAAQPGPAVNTRCPVDGELVDARKHPTVVVKTPRLHRTYVVCCRGCGEALRRRPEQYLKPDGSPRPAPDRR